MRPSVITISRQFGSGGRQVGAELAQRLGVPFYDKALFEEAAKRSGIHPEHFAQAEQQRGRLFAYLFQNNAAGSFELSLEGGAISVRLEKEGRSLKLTVSNATVQSMERDQLNRLFDRFYRMDQSRSSSTGGYGLGMSIAQSIVAVHRGKIRADSPAENLLTVVVTLPQQ